LSAGRPKAGEPVTYYSAARGGVKPCAEEVPHFFMRPERPGPATRCSTDPAILLPRGGSTFHSVTRRARRGRRGVGTGRRKLATDWTTGQIIGGAIDDALAAGGWKQVL
jgi:hypothetical protein